MVGVFRNNFIRSKRWTYLKNKNFTFSFFCKFKNTPRAIFCFLFLHGVSWSCFAALPDPAPVPVGGDYSLEAFSVAHLALTGPRVSSPDDVLPAILATAATFASKYGVTNNWAGCNPIVYDFAALKQGGYDTEHEGWWGRVTGYVPETDSYCYADVFYHNVTWQCPQGYTYEWQPYRHCAPNLVAIVPLDQPPPETCVGNPVEVGTGAKFQVEEDVASGGIGQVFLERRYGNSNPKVAPAWHHNYEKRLVAIDPTLDSMFIQKTGNWGTVQAACVDGWEEIKGSFLPGSQANLIDGKCNVIRGGIIVKTLPIVLNAPFNKLLIPIAVKLIFPDGSAHIYQYTTDNLFTSLDGQPPLERPNSNGIVWRFRSANGEVNEFSLDGRLTKIITSNGLIQTLNYDPVTGYLVKVTDANNNSLSFGYTNGQLSSVTTKEGKTTSYVYNANNLITDVARPNGTHRLYHYEDSRFPTFLTGITDERGIRYVTWRYDANGRAISSEHAGGADKFSIVFNSDGTSTVTNPLGKTTIYYFDDIAGARKVTRVAGQPSANCVGANQNYTYTAEGWLASKTDWKGNLTSYQYNSIGQEISRTEADGTSNARTITTEWDTVLNLRAKVTEPDVQIIYTYDSNGFLKNQTVHSLTSP